MTAHPYDVKFTVVETGAEYGFMLVTPPEETKSLNMNEVGAPPAQRSTTFEEGIRQDFDPMVDTPFAMASFEDGAGFLEYGEMEFGYWWASGIVTHVDGKAFLAPPAKTTLTLGSATVVPDGFYSYFHWDTLTRYDYAWAGTRLYMRNASNDSNAWNLVFTAATAISDFCIFNGNALIAVPDHPTSSINFYYFSTPTQATTWSAPSANHSVFSTADGKPKFWQPVRGTLFAAVDTRKVFYTVDPTQDGWVGPIDLTVSSITAPQVGDASYPFLGLASVNDYVFAFKPTAGYSIDSEQNVTEVLWQWTDKPSPENFKFWAKGGDLLSYVVGPEVYVYDPSSGSNLPLGLARRDGFSVREVYGLAADNQYIYVLARVRVPVLRSADSAALLRCHRVGGSQWAVEVLWEDTDLTGDTYETLAALPDGVGTRLYWGRLNGGTVTTMTMDIPADWDESTVDAFTTSGSLYTSISRANFPGFAKRHLYLSGEANGLSLTETVDVYYSTDAGATWTLLDEFATEEVTLSYGDVHSRGIALRFDFAGDGTASPVLRSFDHHQRVRFRYLPSITAGVRLGNHIETNGGGKSPLSLSALRSAIETLRTTEQRILFEDYTGNSFYCSLDMYNYRPTRHESPSDKFELEAMLLINRADAGA